ALRPGCQPAGARGSRERHERRGRHERMADNRKPGGLTMPLAPGSRLAQYEIVSAVGSGGMGVVYRARDTRLNRDVALKVMAPHIASDPTMRSRFETEARAVASLTRTGILYIYELAV